jgi:hypothetical protein
MTAFFPIATASSAGKAFVEGISISATETHHFSLRITLDAIKRVDGKWRQSEVHLVYHESRPDRRRDIDATVILSGDPDLLEVSKDLGWAGLNSTIYVQWRKADCTVGAERICGPEIVETIPVTLNITVLPNEPYYEESGLFKRNAHLSPTDGVSGTLQTPDGILRLELGWGLHSQGYAFSDQYPG